MKQMIFCLIFLNNKLKYFFIIRVSIYIILCITACLDICFYNLYICSLDIWSADIDSYNVYMKPDGGFYKGDASKGPNYGGDPSVGPNPGGGPKWRPFEYQNLKQDGKKYDVFTASPASVLETYDPSGSIPPKNDKQLGVFMDYNFRFKVRKLGYDYWNVLNSFLVIVW